MTSKKWLNKYDNDDTDAAAIEILVRDASNQRRSAHRSHTRTGAHTKKI